MTPESVSHDDDSGIALGDLLSGYADAGAIPDVRVTGLQLDSRKVRAGDLFVALQGLHDHGLRHASQAISQGCAAIAYEPGAEVLECSGLLERVASVEIDGLAGKLGFFADRFFGHPSRDLCVIGITGTNGKTSCSHFLAEALSEHASSAVVGTLGWGVPGQLQATTHTTPDAIEIHRLLAQLRSAGFSTVAMEASSHGLAQGRLNGVHFRGALFTNFSRDHLDYHGTMESYLAAKLRLSNWPRLEFLVFNAQDTLFNEAVLQARRPDVKYIGFCPTGHHAMLGVPLLTFDTVRHDSAGVTFHVRYAEQSNRVRAPVYGDFNVENIAATLGVLLGLGYPFTEAVEALGRVTAVPGRMENVSIGERSAVIDFAHTPDALACVLSSLRHHCRGKLWLVFGCGGDRDRGKRAEMGGIARLLADVIVLTDDNPRTEDGDCIITDILKGIAGKDVTLIRNRRDAIRHALESAALEDLVLIAGKGHENTQEIQGRKYPFNDREVVEEVLKEIRTRNAGEVVDAEFGVTGRASIVRNTFPVDPQ